MNDFDKPTIYALDFGTSNSLLAAANAERTFPPVPLDPGASDPTVLRSVLYFPNAKQVFFGEEALRRYSSSGLEGRLLRSIKKHLSSRSFHGTWIDDRPLLLEDLVGAILREMRARANAHFGCDVKRAVLGRSARFCEDDADDALAERRLAEAAKRAGFEEISFLPEPVAAAREFGEDAEARGAGDRNVLVADFGGGTSDFTVLRIGARPFAQDDVLAIGGVAIAGDALDASLMRDPVAKSFGADVEYRVPTGANVLRMPKSIIEHLCSPSGLTVLRRQDIAEFLRNVRSWSLGGDDREHLDNLKILVEDGLGFQIFESIERAKRELSASDAAEILFDYAPIDVKERVTRGSFEEGSRRETDAILARLDETVRAAGLDDASIDLVCCTGGTAKVARLAAEIRRRFGDDRVRDWKSFHSVALGLAVHARDRMRAASIS